MTEADTDREIVVVHELDEPTPAADKPIAGWVLPRRAGFWLVGSALAMYAIGFFSFYPTMPLVYDEVE